MSAPTPAPTAETVIALPEDAPLPRTPEETVILASELLLHVRNGEFSPLDIFGAARFASRLPSPLDHIFFEYAVPHPHATGPEQELAKALLPVHREAAERGGADRTHIAVTDEEYEAWVEAADRVGREKIEAALTRTLPFYEESWPGEDSRETPTVEFMTVQAEIRKVLKALIEIDREVIFGRWSVEKGEGEYKRLIEGARPWVRRVGELQAQVGASHERHRK